MKDWHGARESMRDTRGPSMGATAARRSCYICDPESKTTQAVVVMQSDPKPPADGVFCECLIQPCGGALVIVASG
jgi:hypothetical protein